VFSNREIPITTPEGIIDAFMNVDKYLIETTKIDI
jgi:hypothetical protein